MASRPAAISMMAHGVDSSRGTSLPGARVLVAEDSPVIQTLMRALLRRLGCHAAVSQDGEQAVQLALGDQWDLILMDCMMPVSDGYTAARRIREKEAELGRVRVPSAACSASVLAADLERCQAAGMDGFISKPVDPAMLERVVAQHVKASRSAINAAMR